MSSKKVIFSPQVIKQLGHDPSARSSQTEYTDAAVAGLKVAVSKSGRKFWLFRFTLYGKKFVITLGEYPAMTIEQARKAAWAARAQVNAGQHPVTAKQAQLAVPDFATFFREDYLPWAKKAKRSWRDDQAKFDQYLNPVFGQSLMTAIGTRDIEQHIAVLVGKMLKPATCNRHLHLLSAIFRKGVEYGVVAVNPCSTVRAMKENNLRQRYLSPAEVARFLSAANAELNRVAALYVVFLLLTGARREEALQAKWAHINFAASEWIIPQTKSGKARRVPLNVEAIKLLRSLPKEPGNPYVFIGKVAGQPLNNPVKAFRRILARAEISDFRLHDLRHTFASVAVNSGISLYTVQQLLGHSNPKTTERYAHLSNDALLSASGQVGRLVQGALTATLSQPKPKSP